jgi:hypothetical protein
VLAICDSGRAACRSKAPRLDLRLVGGKAQHHAAAVAKAGDAELAVVVGLGLEVGDAAFMSATASARTTR